jgi:hypothetical protein
MEYAWVRRDQSVPNITPEISRNLRPGKKIPQLAWEIYYLVPRQTGPIVETSAAVAKVRASRPQATTYMAFLVRGGQERLIKKGFRSASAACRYVDENREQIEVQLAMDGELVGGKFQPRRRP